MSTASLGAVFTVSVFEHVVANSIVLVANLRGIDLNTELRHAQHVVSGEH